MDNTYLGPEGILAPEAAAQMEVLVVGATPYPNYVTGFPSFADFRQWTDNLPYKDRIDRALEKTEKARALAQGDLSEIAAHQQAITKEIEYRLEELSKRTGLDVNSRELFLQATVDADPLRGPVFNSAQLFEHPNRTGRRLDIRTGQWYCDLSWFGFNDIISSVRVHPWCVLVLCEHAHYMGRWTFFFPGIWWDHDFNLDGVINDKISSAFCLGF